MTLIMSFLAALRGGDTMARFVFVLAVGSAIFAFGIYQLSRVYDAGATAERATITRTNDTARNHADEAERDVLTCPPGKWSRETLTCTQ